MNGIRFTPTVYSGSSSSSASSTTTAHTLGNTSPGSSSIGQGIDHAESVEKFIHALGPIYRFTAARLRSGELSLADAIRRESTIGPVIQKSESGKKVRKIEFGSVIRDCIISGITSREDATELSRTITEQSLINLSHPITEKYLLNGALSFDLALSLTTSDLRELSRASTRRSIDEGRMSVFLALI